MKVLGFNFTKLHAERLERIASVKKITTNIEFLNVEKETIEAMKEADVLKLTFKYETVYEPNNATILCEGVAHITLEPELLKEAVKQWKKKQIDPTIKVPLLNILLKKCTLRAFEMEDNLGLPTHIPLPKLKS